MKQAASRLKNIGPKSTEWLQEIGIQTREDLITIGPAMAYLILKHRFPGVSIVMLYALHGAADNRHWNSYSPEEKTRMKAEADGNLEIRTRL